MRRRHKMPFGAQYEEDGSVRFRLWAPAAQQVALSLAGTDTGPRFALEGRDGGWFELVTNRVRPGTQYFFQIDHTKQVPDPASRFQPKDVHGPSQLVDPHFFDWQDHTWIGRPWEEAVTYEVHVGAFTPSGTFAALRERLDYLADLGVTALELMPVADFPGQRNWGYDGVYHFAPDSSYGTPEDLKQLIQSAHARDMMVLLDVVYNHFGPEGNYLHSYAPQFFTDRHRTPWGDGINFDGPESQPVRSFFIHNALYWLLEYHFDGLRLDAVHAITDESTPDILSELAESVRSAIPQDRHVHLILENDRNQAHYLQPHANCQPRAYTAQWNDDIHHALHVLVTGEHDGYYADYSKCPRDQVGRCLVEGFSYQGEASTYRRGLQRGESCEGLPLSAFVSFLQNHDQVGNRAFGERIIKIARPRAVRVAMAILLLAPSPPLLFMGEEFGAESPFLFFCDFEKQLAAAATAGRRNEFAHFVTFSDVAARARIPDPSSAATFEASRLDWNALSQPRHQEWLSFYRDLLSLRRQHVIPRISAGCSIKAGYEALGEHGLSAHWDFQDQSQLCLIANLGPGSLSGVSFPSSQIIYISETVSHTARGSLPSWFVAWSLTS